MGSHEGVGVRIPNPSSSVTIGDGERLIYETVAIVVKIITYLKCTGNTSMFVSSQSTVWSYPSWWDLQPIPKRRKGKKHVVAKKITRVVFVEPVYKLLYSIFNRCLWRIPTFSWLCWYRQRSLEHHQADQACAQNACRPTASSMVWMSASNEWVIHFQGSWPRSQLDCLRLCRYQIRYQRQGIVSQGWTIPKHCDGDSFTNPICK